MMTSNDPTDRGGPNHPPAGHDGRHGDHGDHSANGANGPPWSDAIRPAMIGSAIAVVAMLALSLYAWDRVPDRTPIHWNLRGEIDDHADKAFGLLVLPVLALLVGVLFAVAPRFDRKGSSASSTTAYVAITLVTQAVFGVGHAVVVLTALGHEVSAPRLIGLALGGMFLVLGNFMPKIRRNGILGVRTPWTLADERVWNRTHRMAGPVFMLVGAAVMLAALIGDGSDALIVLLVASGVAACLITAYSWRLSRSDLR